MEKPCEKTEVYHKRNNAFLETVAWLGRYCVVADSSGEVLSSCSVSGIMA